MIGEKFSEQGLGPSVFISMSLNDCEFTAPMMLTSYDSIVNEDDVVLNHVWEATACISQVTVQPDLTTVGNYTDSYGSPIV